MTEEPTPVEPGTIIVPLDGSHEATEAIPAAVALATRSRSRIVLLRAIAAAGLADPDDYLQQAGIEQREHSLRRSQAEGYLAAIRNWIEGQGLDVTTFVNDGALVTVVLRLVEETPGAVMVVVTSSSRTTSQPSLLWVDQLMSALERLAVPLLFADDQTG